MTASSLIVANNTVWLGFSLLVFLLFSYRLLKTEKGSDVRMLMRGVQLVAFGTCFHRLWWTVWRFTKLEQVENVSIFLDTNALIASLISATLVVIGYSLHMKTVFEGLLGKRWWAIAAGLALIIWTGAHIFFVE
tara:strand:+ start:1768 stop:2169 length:402 start_codon:yes stop_codon:yes gene_type:complete